VATVEKTKKNSHLWFSDITDPEQTVLPKLKELAAEQAVELCINGKHGIWTRFKGNTRRVPPALKRGNEDAELIWDALTDKSSIEILRILTVDESRQFSRERADRVELVPIKSENQSNVLCLGVDVAWWGGGGRPSDHSSRTETVAYATRMGGIWSELSLKRVDLNQSYDRHADDYTPNSDPDASLLFKSIESVIDLHANVDGVMLALDMPILAQDEGMNPPKKSYKVEEEGGEYRQCDRKWMDSKSQSPAGWRSVNIMTGAPIAPRIKALIEQLESNGFVVYGKRSEPGNPSQSNQKIVFECFPNEILWSTGVLGLAEGLTFETLQLYKSIGKKKAPLPKEVFHAIWNLPVKLALEAAGLPDETITSWQSCFQNWLIEDKTFDAEKGIGTTGKQFDDAIDSVLSLAAVVGFVQGKAHIHQGDDALDGHIIGPGLQPVEVENHVPSNI
jgi:hypothetical protein